MDYVPGSAAAAGASNVPLAGSAEAQMAYMNQLWLARAQQEQQAAAAAAAALALGSGSRPTSFYDPSLYPEQHFLMTPLSAEPPHRVPSPHVPGGGQFFAPQPLSPYTPAPAPYGGMPPFVDPRTSYYEIDHEEEIRRLQEQLEQVRQSGTDLPPVRAAPPAEAPLPATSVTATVTSVGGQQSAALLQSLQDQEAQLQRELQELQEISNNQLNSQQDEIARLRRLYEEQAAADAADADADADAAAAADEQVPEPEPVPVPSPPVPSPPSPAPQAADDDLPGYAELPPAPLRPAPLPSSPPVSSPPDRHLTRRPTRTAGRLPGMTVTSLNTLNLLGDEDDEPLMYVGETIRRTSEIPPWDTFFIHLYWALVWLPMVVVTIILSVVVLLFSFHTKGITLGLSLLWSLTFSWPTTPLKRRLEDLTADERELLQRRPRDRSCCEMFVYVLLIPFNVVSFGVLMGMSLVYLAVVVPALCIVPLFLFMFLYIEHGNVMDTLFARARDMHNVFLWSMFPWVYPLLGPGVIEDASGSAKVFVPQTMLPVDPPSRRLSYWGMFTFILSTLLVAGDTWSSAHLAYILYVRYNNFTNDCSVYEPGDSTSACSDESSANMYNIYMAFFTTAIFCAIVFILRFVHLVKVLRVEKLGVYLGTRALPAGSPPVSIANQKQMRSEATFFSLQISKDVVQVYFGLALMQLVLYEESLFVACLVLVKVGLSFIFILLWGPWLGHLAYSFPTYPPEDAAISRPAKGPGRKFLPVFVTFMFAGLGLAYIVVFVQFDVIAALTFFFLRFGS